MADTWKLEDCHYDPNVMLSVEYDWAGTCQLHGHEFSEIVVILEGKGEHFFVDGQKYPLGDRFKCKEITSPKPIFGRLY